ncbi:MAG: lamin tail domain-containing protein, partial [Syntrophobacterales bacterium]
MLAAHWREKGCPVVINEILAHSHAAAPDWIELHNTGSIPVNVGGWLLSDKKNDLYKFQIAADTVIEPFAYIVFYESTHFGNPLNPDTWATFALSENG